MKKLVCFLITIAVVITTTIPVLAHSGRTDENGGHLNHATGEYHYHHGHPAHQHENGVCPYAFDDKTGQNGGGSGSSGGTSEYGSNDNLGYYILFGIAAVILVVWLIYRSRKELRAGDCDTLIWFSAITIPSSAMICLFSLLLYSLDTSDDLLAVIAVSAVILAIGIIVLGFAFRWQKNRAKQILPDFKMYFTQRGKCYHSTPDCHALKKSKSVNWGTKEINYMLLLSKQPCPKCCTSKNGKILSKRTQHVPTSAQENKRKHDKKHEDVAKSPSCSTAPKSDEVKIKMYPVESSNIHSIGYVKDILIVRFHSSGIYAYKGVSPHLFNGLLLKNQSCGKLFNTYVRDHYYYEYISDICTCCQDEEGEYIAIKKKSPRP